MDFSELTSRSSVREKGVRDRLIGLGFLMAKDTLFELDGDIDNLPPYEFPSHKDEPCVLPTTEASLEIFDLEYRLTKMIRYDDGSGFISLVEQYFDHSNEGEGMDPSLACRLLQLACKVDSATCAQVLIEGQTGAVININEMDECGRSPLHYAAQMLSTKCIKLLLQKHAQTYIRTKDFMALLPLEIALASQRMLVDWSPNESVEELLFSLNDMDLSAIELLVEATKNLTELSYMLAVEGQVIELASLLLVVEDNAEGTANLQGINSLSLPTINVMYELVLEELLKLLEMEKDCQYWKSFHRIYEKRQTLLRQIELLHLFGVPSVISLGDKKILLPLLRASEAGDELLVVVLLKQNVDVNSTDEDGNSALHCFFKGNTRSKNPRILWHLLNHGARVYEHNKYGFTPVHLASQKGNYEALKVMLLHAPECVDDLSVTNETPLLLAVKRNFINCVKLLLQFGARRDVLNLRSQRPIDLAISDEMRCILRTYYPRIVGYNKLIQDDGASYPFVEESIGCAFRNFWNQRTTPLSKKYESIELDDKIGTCRYFHSPNGCSRGGRCHYSHAENAQSLEMSGKVGVKCRVLTYHKKDPAHFKDDTRKKIFVGGLPPIDSDELKKVFEEEFGPVEHATVICTNDGSHLPSESFGFLTFKREDIKEAAVKAQFITLFGKTVEIRRVIRNCQILPGTYSSFSDHRISQDLTEINDTVPVDSFEPPPWLATFKNWFPTYLEKACKRLDEGEWYPLSSLKGDFRATCGMELDHESLGFPKLSDFLRSQPGLCRMLVTSSGNASPTHVVLRPFYPFPCHKPPASKHASPPAPQSGALSLPHSPSMSGFSDSAPSSDDFELPASIVTSILNILDEGPDPNMPHQWGIPGMTGAEFLDYNLWRQVRVPEEVKAPEKAPEPFSLFLHQLDELLGRDYRAVRKSSPGTDLIGSGHHTTCLPCNENRCSPLTVSSCLDSKQINEPAGFDEESPPPETMQNMEMLNFVQEVS